MFGCHFMCPSWMFLLWKSWLTFDFHRMTDPRRKLDPSDHLVCIREGVAKDTRRMVVRQVDQSPAVPVQGSFRIPFPFSVWMRSLLSSETTANIANTLRPPARRNRYTGFIILASEMSEFLLFLLQSHAVPPFPDTTTTTVMNLVCAFMSFCFPCITYPNSVLSKYLQTGDDLFYFSCCDFSLLISCLIPKMEPCWFIQT